MQKKYSDRALANAIAESVAERGGTAYFVGGYVRDALRGIDSEDIDIEIHGITPEALQDILSRFGECLTVGAPFGVYNIKGYEVDFALPRTETATGSGHRDFEIAIDPFMGVMEAARRRDFTINSLMQNVLTGEIVDSFGGIDDLNKNILRHIDDRAFPEDPLRALRAAQFAARFELTIDEKTLALCSSMPLSELPAERVAGELKKALLQADKPSIFFNCIRAMGQLHDWFPEVEQLIGVPQSPKFHPEGDVWNHTMLTLDGAAMLRSQAEHRREFMYAALTHDFGKAVTTQIDDGRIRSVGHETQGLPLVKSFLKRLKIKGRYRKYVTNLVSLHMCPNQFAEDGTRQKSWNRLFDRCCCPPDLFLLAYADRYGQMQFDSFDEHREVFEERLGTFKKTMEQPYVTGDDLIKKGFVPDSRFSSAMAYAHRLRLSGVRKEVALRMTIAYLEKQQGKDDDK